MVVSSRNLLFQGSIFRGELLVSGRVSRVFCGAFWSEGCYFFEKSRSINEQTKKPNGWFFDIGDEILPSYMGIIVNHLVVMPAELR